MANISNSSRLGYIRKRHYESDSAMVRTKAAPTVRDKDTVAAILTSRESAYRAEKCRRDFSFFIQTFWPEVSMDTLSWNWHIDYLATELMTVAKNVGKVVPRPYDLIVNIPPGTTKSITTSIMFPVWCWTNWPWMKFIVASYSGALALEHAEISRDLVKSNHFQELFPDITIKQDKDTKSNFRLMHRNGDEEPKAAGSRLSTSVGGTLTGFHGHILIVDDPLDPNRAVSEVELAKSNRWMDQTLSTRKINKEVTPTILIMQRLHENDPTGHILATKRKNIKHISLPGEIRSYRKQLKPATLASCYIDDLLDPKRIPWRVLSDMEMTLGQYGYAGQVGQNPVPPSGGMFKPDRIQTIAPAQAYDNPFEEVVRYWDKAGTQDGGAHSVGVKMGKLKGVNKFIVLDIKRGQWSTEIREAMIRSTAEADGHSVIIGHEQEPGSGGLESADATIRNLSGYSTYKERPTGDKVFRADPYSVQVNNGNVMMVQADWNQAYIDELRFFPKGTYKDQVDASSGAFKRLNDKKKAWML